jgi:hypothetical protein
MLGRQVKVGVALTFGFCSMFTTELSVATQALLFLTVKKVLESWLAINEKLGFVPITEPAAEVRHSYVQSVFEIVFLVIVEPIQTKVSFPAEALGSGIIFHKNEVSWAGQTIWPVVVSDSITSPFVLSCLEGM